jgi:hypothetical protein
MGNKTGIEWTDDDRQFMRWLYPHVKTDKIAVLLGRGVSTVYQQAAKMGLRKTEEFRTSAESGILRKGEWHEGSVATRFQKGQTPANKGLRRPGYAPGRMRETQFKKGCRTGVAAENWCPIGTIRADSEGYLRVKVREGTKGEAYGFGNTRIWPLLQRHVWEQEKGPIPPGHVICFVNGDRSNSAIENLECISRADLARRNAMWRRYPRDLALAIQMNGALKRKMRRLNREQHEKQDDRPAQPPI